MVGETLFHLLSQNQQNSICKEYVYSPCGVMIAKLRKEAKIDALVVN